MRAIVRSGQGVKMMITGIPPHTGAMILKDKGTLTNFFYKTYLFRILKV